MTDILELASLAEGAGFWNTLGFDLDHYSHRSFYWPIASHLPSGACCVFGGDRLWPGPEPSFVLVLHVPLSWALFVKESGGKGGGAVTLLDCSTNTTGWCMRRVSSGKAAILQAISGLARQELCTICTHCMERVRGREWWAERGGERWRDTAIGRCVLALAALKHQKLVSLYSGLQLYMLCFYTIII